MDTILRKTITDKLERVASTGRCQFCDFRNANLLGMDLREIDFRRANFSGANLSGVNLTSANLSGSNLNESNLTNTNLTKAILYDVTLRRARLINTNLDEAVLHGADLSNTHLAEVELSYAKLAGANLSRTNLSSRDLKGKALNGANLTEANLAGTDLSKANLTAANLEGATLTNAKLSGAYLYDAKLIDADFRGSDLSGARITGADLTDANFRGANLGHIKLARTGNNFKKDIIQIEESSDYSSVTSFDLSGDADYLTTKHGVLYEFKNGKGRIALDLRNNAEFLNFGESGLLGVASNNKNIYISYGREVDAYKGKWPFQSHLAFPWINQVVRRSELLMLTKSMLFYSTPFHMQLQPSPDHKAVRLTPSPALKAEIPISLQYFMVDEYSKTFHKMRNILEVRLSMAGHMAGSLAFDNFGKLYVSIGDGGPQGDLHDMAQNLESLRGKILRIDVSEKTPRPHIVAYGLRNPWKFTIDSRNRMFIGDCGWSKIESAYFLKDLYPLSPYNLGWPIFEGTERRRKDPLKLEDTLAPIYEYKHYAEVYEFKRYFDYIGACIIGGLFLDEFDLYIVGDNYGILRLLEQQSDEKWVEIYSQGIATDLWSFGFDSATKQIFISGTSKTFELTIPLNRLKQLPQVILCRTTLPDGSINNSDC